MKKILFIIIFIVIILVGVYLTIDIRNKQLLKIETQNHNKMALEIQKHYNNYVITNKEANIYNYDENSYKVIGKISANETIELLPLEITYDTLYFKIANFDSNYYINYNDVNPIEELKEYSDRYKKYILFNENIITKKEVNFYNNADNIIYNIKQSFTFPIIIKDNNKYGVEFNNRLLYIKKEDIEEIINTNNTNEKNTTGIAVLNYHFFYDETSKEDTAKCNQSICLSTEKLKKHLDYIKENNIFTPTMNELEMYIDGKIKLPKSVVLTIDDGWRADIGSKIMDEYKLNATVFLISKDYDKNAYKTDYIEVHSHGHDLHNRGVCPGGQGGGIKCLSKSVLLEDLKASREKLDNTTVFCYPFYEYNNYSIEVLKEAGFTMAFGGPKEGGYSKVSPNINKYKLPRYVIYNNTGVDKIKSYIN